MLRYPIILIDNGHGKDTAGKRSPDQSFFEWKWNREIAERLVLRLKGEGYTAFRIVKEDEDVSLKERCARVNSYCSHYGTGNVILISIHSNAAGNGRDWMKARGWSVYTSPGETKADPLATCIFNAASEVCVGQKMRADWSDGDPDYEANFYILKHTKCPAVLTESYFYDNKADLVYLTSDTGKADITELHFQGIRNYIESL